MRKTKSILLLAAVMSLPLAALAQTENPRGIYKLMTITGKQGEVTSPFDQYKICTDEVTLMANVQNGRFRIADNDRKVFNYTGSEPKDENDHSTLIYDSNAEQFTLKWWSNNQHHMIFPDDGWCIEKYYADKYSPEARHIFDALTAIPSTDSENPLLGTWRVIGWMDELQGASKQLKQLQENYAKSKYVGQYVTINPQIVVFTYVDRPSQGMLRRGQCFSKNQLKIGQDTKVMKWLSKDVVAMEMHDDWRTDWQILERVTDTTPLLDLIIKKAAEK